ncbi:MAG: helix-turn-helix transcriptional regulator [Clostridia bacterium]|nr:helix-turn-helix transcriptional regulator [Clostridia bacterium]
MTDFVKTAPGTVIKELRKESGLSQEVLSGLAGIARSHIAMIESGQKQPNFETIWKLAVALNIPPHKLVKKIEEEAERVNGRIS